MRTRERGKKAQDGVTLYIDADPEVPEFYFGNVAVEGEDDDENQSCPLTCWCVYRGQK